MPGCPIDNISVKIVRGRLKSLGPTQLNLFANHLQLENEYMRCDRRRKEMAKLLFPVVSENNKIPEVGHFSGVSGRIRNSAANSMMRQMWTK